MHPAWQKRRFLSGNFAMSMVCFHTVFLNASQVSPSEQKCILLQPTDGIGAIIGKINRLTFLT